MAARTGTYRPWTPADVAQLRALAAEGHSAKQLEALLGRSWHSVHTRAQREGIRIGRAIAETPPVHSGTAVEEWEARRDAAERSVQRDREHRAEVFDWLRPVELPAPTIPKVKFTANAFTMVIGDMHFPTHDEATLSTFLQAAAALKPRRIILNGDTVDLLAVSRYPKDARRSFTWKLRDEVKAFHEFLHSLHSVVDAWGCEVVETNSNHAGNGVDGRWWRYLSDRVPSLLEHDDAEENLSYQRWFYPKWSSIRLVDEVVVANDLLVVHGDMVRGKGGYSARAHQEKWMSSTLNSHTHRLGSTVRRVPAVGSRPEGILRSYEIGCACSLSPSYSRVPDWTNGWAVITHDDARETYGVELVNVVRGSAAVTALGHTLAA
jgi:hypothetical protein